MTAREIVLAAVRAARPAAMPRPAVREAVRGMARPAYRDDDRVPRFREAAREAGAQILEGPRSAFANLLAQSSPDLFICEAVLGVAENGAVWLPWSRLGAYRAALLLATEVIVVLDRSAIVDDLHDAYARRDVADGPWAGHGVFVAGPSKTADIEQSLVVGAHGAKCITLILVEDI